MCLLNTLKTHAEYIGTIDNIPNVTQKTGLMLDTLRTHLPNTLKSHFGTHSKCNSDVPHWAHCGRIVGHILNVANFCPADTLESLVACVSNVSPMCPLGIWVLVPSESTEVGLLRSRGYLRLPDPTK